MKAAGEAWTAAPAPAGAPLPVEGDEDPETAKQRRLEEEKEEMTDRIHTFLQEMGLLKAEVAVPFCDSGRFQFFIALVIVFNAVLLGIETDTGRTDLLVAGNIFCGSVYVIELILRLRVHRLNFFKDFINIFDFVLVILVLADLIMMAATTESQMDGLAVLRMVRLLRLVRLVRLFHIFRELFLIVESIGQAARSLLWAFFLLGVWIFIFALFLSILLGEAKDWQGIVPANKTQSMRVFPNQTSANFTAFDTKEYFGSLAKSSLTLFQVMTFDHWMTSVVRPLLKADRTFEVFMLIVFQALAAYGILNIVLGVVTANVMSNAQDRDEAVEEKLLDEQAKLLLSLRDFFLSCDFDGSGTLELDELESAARSPVLIAVMKQIGIPFRSIPELFRFLDADRSGSVTFEEFIQGIIKLKHPPAGKETLMMKVRMERSQKVADDFVARGERVSQICQRLVRTVDDATVGGGAYAEKSPNPVVILRKEGFIQRSTYLPPAAHRLHRDRQKHGLPGIPSLPPRDFDDFPN